MTLHRSLPTAHRVLISGSGALQFGQDSQLLVSALAADVPENPLECPGLEIDLPEVHMNAMGQLGTLAAVRLANVGSYQTMGGTAGWDVAIPNEQHDHAAWLAFDNCSLPASRNLAQANLMRSFMPLEVGSAAVSVVIRIQTEAWLKCFFSGVCGPMCVCTRVMLALAPCFMSFRGVHRRSHLPH